jgi:hypothetical protein
MTKKVELDLDAVDRLALVSLNDHRRFLMESFEAGDYFHIDDQKKSAKLIDAFTEVIKYYGGK